jgi:hypothetical protein
MSPLPTDFESAIREILALRQQLKNQNEARAARVVELVCDIKSLRGMLRIAERRSERLEQILHTHGSKKP